MRHFFTDTLCEVAQNELFSNKIPQKFYKKIERWAVDFTSRKEADHINFKTDINNSSQRLENLLFR